MAAFFPIRYLQRKEIDTLRWDDCIRQAANGVIYTYSFYLDAMAGDWDGLVLGDYEMVMPLPRRKKWGFYYLYQPFLIAQLGVFGNDLSPAIVNAFLLAVPKKFRYWDMPLNKQNLFSLADFVVYQRMNYVLPLSPSYDALYKNYKETTKRNLKKHSQSKNQLTKDLGLDTIIHLTKLQAQEVSDKEFASFKNLFQSLSEKGMAKTYGIVSEKGDLLASATFVFSHRRAYYILVGNHPSGRTAGASHALLDAFIQDHAGLDLLLDFEGSDANSLAFFYRSFGATEEPYAAITLNRLPWWVKWAKA